MFKVKKRIRFAHCDPAGIVFYPRYAELCNEVVEDWFNDGLGVSFYTLQEELGVGIPAVRLEIEFLAPSTYGETLEFELGVKEIGNTSILLEVKGRHDGEERVRIQLRGVMISRDNRRPIQIPEEWRLRFAPYLDDTESEGRLGQSRDDDGA